MELEAALCDLAAALAAREGERRGEARLRAARQVMFRRCAEALGIEERTVPSLAAVIRLAADSQQQSARRDCAVLLVHALSVAGLVPPAAAGPFADWRKMASATRCCDPGIHSADRSRTGCECYNACIRRLAI